MYRQYFYTTNFLREEDPTKSSCENRRAVYRTVLSFKIKLNLMLVIMWSLP